MQAPYLYIPRDKPKFVGEVEGPKREETGNAEIAGYVFVNFGHVSIKTPEYGETFKYGIQFEKITAEVVSESSGIPEVSEIVSDITFDIDVSVPDTIKGNEIFWSI
jgi:hypothetical protein